MSVDLYAEELGETKRAEGSERVGPVSAGKGG